jgi:cell division protein FtsW (lipid II flippase)
MHMIAMVKIVFAVAAGGLLVVSIAAGMHDRPRTNESLLWVLGWVLPATGALVIALPAPYVIDRPYPLVQPVLSFLALLVVAFRVGRRGVRGALRWSAAAALTAVLLAYCYHLVLKYRA